MDEARLIAIPDIHGRNDLLGELMTALESGLPHWAPLGAHDRLVFLGDMIDRGFDSRGVIERLQALQRVRPNTVVLRGNHEGFLLDVYRGPEHERADVRECWYREGNGGRMTVASYQGLVPDSVLDWVESLPLRFEEGGFFFSHAPVPKDNRRLPMMIGREFSPEELAWSYDADEPGWARDFRRAHNAPRGEITGVCGHIHQARRGVYTPRFYLHYLYCDAGCGCHPRAPLVAVDVRARRYLAVDSGEGRYRLRVMGEL